MVSAVAPAMPLRELRDSKVSKERETSPSLEEITDRIFKLESSGGKYNYSKCKEIGKYNRYGFGIPGNGKFMCFEKDEDTKAVKGWFKDKLKTHDLESAACGYNTGTFEKGCLYYQKFVSL